MQWVFAWIVMTCILYEYVCIWFANKFEREISLTIFYLLILTLSFFSLIFRIPYDIICRCTIVLWEYKMKEPENPHGGCWIPMQSQVCNLFVFYVFDKDDAVQSVLLYTIGDLLKVKDQEIVALVVSFLCLYAIYWWNLRSCCAQKLILKVSRVIFN